jgi:hypothetical protein
MGIKIVAESVLTFYVFGDIRVRQSRIPQSTHRHLREPYFYQRYPFSVDLHLKEVDQHQLMKIAAGCKRIAVNG